MNLSKRLLKITEYITHGDRVADIGTDHALIPIYLVSEHICSSAIAADLNKGPVEAALNNVREAELSKAIDVRLGDGLSVLSPGEVNTIVMAGMGGGTITSILKKEPSVVSGLSKLVLQPMTDEEVVRIWLCENDWIINDEELVCEDGRIYIIIKAEQGSCIDLSGDEIRFGPRLLEKKHPLLKQKLILELEHKKKIYSQVRSNATEKALGRVEVLRNEVEGYERVLKWL